MGELSMAKPGREREKVASRVLNPVYGCARIESCPGVVGAERMGGGESKERMKLFNDVKYKVLCLVVRSFARSSGTEHK